MPSTATTTTTTTKAKETFGTCETCGKVVEFGDWECPKAQGGEGQHVVERKTYYAPTGGLMWQWKMDKSIPLNDGSGGTRHIPHRSIRFQTGVYVTTDPEEQHALDHYRGLISYEAWREIFVPKEQRMLQDQRELEKLRRIEKENSTELERLRKRVADQEAAKKAEVSK